MNENLKISIKLKGKSLNELKRGEYCEFGESLKLAPLKENLIIEMLPEEILLYIFQFLSPGDLIRIASTCKAFNKLSQDKNTWRNISYNYNQFFLLNKVKAKVEQKEFAYEEDIIPIYGIIEQTQFLTDDVDGLSFKDRKKLKKMKSTLTNLFKKKNQNNDENENENENELDHLFNQNEIKDKLIEYIEKVPNPKEELISKANLIYEALSERKEKVEENLKRRKVDRKISQNSQITHGCSFGNLILLALGVVAFIITLNIYIEKKLSSNILYVFIPILLPVLLFVIILLISSKLEDDWKFFVYGIGMIILFTQLLLIGLRSDSTIKGSWLLIFLPFFILFGIAFIGSFFLIFDTSHFECINIITSVLIGLIFLFLIFLGLRLDDKITWNYGVVFIPLFLINLFPVFYGWSLFIKSPREEYVGISVCTWGFCGFFIISIPILLFEIFLVLFLEGNSKFQNITYAFIPLYIGLGFSMCGTIILSCTLLIGGIN